MFGPCAIMIIETGEERQEQFAGRNCYMIVTFLSLLPLRRDGMLKLVHAPDVVTTLVVSDAASMTNIVPANNLTSEYAPDAE